MFDYDVAISFAGEQRREAEAIAKCLTDSGVKVFYDKYEQANLWGKDLMSTSRTSTRTKRAFV